YTGAPTLFPPALGEREYIKALSEEPCGGRLTFNYMRIGGVAWDVPPAWREKALAYVRRFEPLIDEFNDLISYNRIYTERLGGVAVVSAQDAIDYNLVGPNLRGSGVQYDVRRDEPYSVYPELEFEIPVRR